jgi:replicative DNA helicase
VKKVPSELLQQLASIIRATEVRTGPAANSGSVDIEKWIGNYRLDVEGPTDWNGGRRWVFRTCPWNPDHRNRSAFILQFPSGAVSAGCHHNGCGERNWHDLRDVVEPGWRSKHARRSGEHSDGNTEWSLPIPFDRFTLPRYPTAVLPDWWRSFVEEEAIATQTPVDLACMLTLSVVAAACAKKVVVEAKPGYREPVNIFTVTALPPGNRKTAVFSAALKPLEDYEQAEAKRTAAEIAHKQTAYKIKQATLKRLEEQAVGAEGNKRVKLTQEASALAAELAATVVSGPTRCIADDCTPEKLPALLQDQGGRIAVMSAEGDVFDLMSGRYSTNQTSNFGVYLRGHAGDTIRVDRVGRAPEFVKAPALTVGLAVQPEIVRGLAKKPGFRGRGLLGRFLYSMPVSLLGYRNTNAPAVRDEVCATYTHKTLALLNLPFGQEANGEANVHILMLDADARERIQEFEAWLEPQLSPFGELGRMTDWGGKLVGAVIRIAGLLHMGDLAGVDAPWTVPIPASTMERAIRIGRYLIPHAKAAFAQMAADEVTEQAKALLGWIKHKDLSSFTQRDAHQGMRSTFKSARDMELPLSMLLDRGFIRQRLEEQSGTSGRPPSPTFDVNPIWASQNTQNTQITDEDPGSEYCEGFEKEQSADGQNECY